MKSRMQENQETELFKISEKRIMKENGLKSKDPEIELCPI